MTDTNKTKQEPRSGLSDLAVKLAAGRKQLELLAELAAERTRQDEKWGGAQVDDARKTPEDWCLDIEAYNTWACQMHRMGSPEKYRRRMLQVAALALAACESFDRQAAN
jgi:hypothetical protein